MTVAVGLDVGGTKLAGGVVDLDDGTVLERRVVATRPERGGRAVLADCAALVAALAPPDSPVGVALCEFVTADGAPDGADTVDWRGLDVGAALGRTAVIESDVVAAAIAEGRYGAAGGLGSFLYFSVGSGVSYSLVVDGVAYRGSRGHAIVVGAPPVERVAGGAALARRFGRPAADVLAGAGGTAVAAEVADELATAIAWLVNALDPEAVIVGGGLGLAPQIFERVTAVVPERLYEPRADGPPILRAGLGDVAPLVGAAAAATGQLALAPQRSVAEEAG